MTITTNRRAMLGAVAAFPAALAAFPAAAAPAVSPDPVWPKLVADFRAKFASWVATIDLEEEADDTFRDACASLPPEPIQPGSASEGDILDKTLREIRDACDAPGHKAAWADYERDHAEWKTQRDALRDRIVGPAKAKWQRTYALRCDAFDALTAYRVTNLRDLGEKIEIIRQDYEGSDIPPEYVTDILADVRHLLGEA